MAEVINTNVFDAEKKFVDFAGLDYFWDKAKEHIDGADAALSGRIDTATGDISDLKTTVGDVNSGLVKDLATLTGRVDALGGAEGGIDSMIDAKINALDSADAAVAGEYVSSVAQADGKITVVRAALPDYSETYDEKGAAAAAQSAAEAKAAELAGANATAIDGLAGRIGSLEGISHASDVKYEGGYINLYDAKGAKIGAGFDASDFVKDGILDSVNFEEVDGVKTNNLVFTFNTDAGKQNITVDFSKYVDTYHADNSSIVLDSSTNTFSVKEVAASKTKLGQKIVIAGGPLANNIAESGEVWPAKWTDGNEKFIPEDATMADIVMNLFCVEKWPTNVTTGNASLVSTMETPSLTYNGKTANNNSTTVEVGTTVSYEAKSGKSSYTATPYKASGFTYGYSAENDNTKDNAGTSKSASFGTISAVSDSIPTLTLSGKVSETINGTAATETAGAASKSGSVVIALGDNKIKAQSKSITYTGTCSALPVYYGCSNLGNTEKELSTGEKQTYPSTAKSETTLTSTAVDSGTIEINCVGAYQVFVGYVAEVPTTSAGVRAMNANNRLGKGSCGTTDEVYTINNNYMVVAVPTGWDFTIQNDLGQADQRNSFSKSDAVVNVELPNHTEEAPNTVSYDIWSIGWSGGAYKNLVIK